MFVEFKEFKSETGKPECFTRRKIEIDDIDTYSVDTTLAYIMLPLISKFKEHATKNKVGYWGSKKGKKELKKIIKALQLIIDREEGREHWSTPEELEKIENDKYKGLVLLGKRLTSMWW